MDGFLNIPELTENERELIIKAKQAITTGKFQQLQRDVNKLKTATRKTPIKPVVLLEQLIKIMSVYPLEHVHRGTITPITEPKIIKELTPEIIISESFNI